MTVSRVAKVVLAFAALVIFAACSKPPGEASSSPPTTTTQTATTAPTGPLAPAKTEAPAGAYALDRAHASLTFKVSHLGFSNYTARFTSFDAQLQLDPADPTKSSIAATIDPASLELNTPPPGFLDDIRGPQWLDVAQFPLMKYQSTKVELTGANTARITGDFTLHGITKPVILDATFNGGYPGMALDPHARVGFSAKGTFKRSDFGISVGVPAPGTTFGVGDEVEVLIETEFTGPTLAGVAPSPAPALASTDAPLALTGIAFVDSSVTGQGGHAQLPAGAKIYPLGTPITGTDGCSTNRYGTDGLIVAVIDYNGRPTAASLGVTRHPASGGSFDNAPYQIDLDPGRTLQFLGPITENGSYDLHMEWDYAQGAPHKADGSFTLARNCPQPQ